MSWWNEEVRFLQPKAQRKPYTPAMALKKTGVVVAVAGTGFLVGMLGYALVHSRFAHYMARSAARGFVYSAIFNATGLRVHGGRR